MQRPRWWSASSGSPSASRARTTRCTSGRRATTSQACFRCSPASALLDLGLVTLWRTRRSDEALWRRSLRWAAIGAAGLVGSFFVLYPLEYAYVSTHVARPPVDGIDLGLRGRHRPLRQRAGQRAGQPLGPGIFNRVVTAGTAVFSTASPPKHLIDRRRDRPAGHVHHYAAGVGDGEEERFNRVWVTSAHRTHARASTSSGQSASSTTPCERTSHKDVTA